MPRELRIHVDVDSAGRYEFRMRAGRREVTTSANPDLAASFFEDLRLFRWKSVGIHDPGDILLSDVGDRLAALVAAPATWEELKLSNDAKYVRVQFSQAAHRLMQFPWELLRVNDRFLIGEGGSHLKRELPSPVPKRKRRNPVTNIVHVSFGTDSNLRLDEERCMLLETIPAEIPIEFLFYSSARRLEVEIDAFRPHIVIVSGHGHYDELQGEHYLSLRDDGYIRTAEIVALCASYGCELLVLSTCESARLGGPVVDDGTVLPADVIAFSFPVMTTTATQSIECLLSGVIRGQTVDEAMAAVRAIDSDDEYAFFNAVHLHRSRSRSLHISNAAPRQPGAPATRCPGMEFTLGWLNGYAHWEEPATLLAAAGSGGETLIRHWTALVCVSFGLRISEALALKWSDVDWLGARLHVHRGIVRQHVDDVKTDESEQFMETDAGMLDRLKSWKQMSQFTTEDDWIFASSAKLGRLPWSYPRVWQVFQEAAKNAGIGKLATHTMRHSYRAWLDLLGTKLAVQQKLMRHADIRTTMNTYGDVVTPEMSEAHSKVVGLALNGLQTDCKPS